MRGEESIVNGALAPAATSEPRHALADDLALTVEPAGRTALYRRTGIKFPGGRRTSFLVGEIDGVRVAVTRRDGITHVVLTRGEIVP